MKKIFRKIAHLIFGIRQFNDRCIKAYTHNIQGKKVLEIGSGTHEYGKDYYSAKKYFDASNEFIQSDINPDYGHSIVDITKMDAVEAYDIIICMNVLEHVYQYQLAISNMFRALKPGGELIVFVPMFYPLHDEPYDYWRFTEHGLRKMMHAFEIVEFKKKGLREMSVGYFMVGRKVG